MDITWLRMGCIAVIALAATRPVAAQSVTSGAIEGRVTDAETGEPLPGVTVWAVGPRTDPQTAITDGDGAYKITELVPGLYTVTFYVDTRQLNRPGVRVGANDVVPVFQKVDPATEDGAQVIEIHDIPPQINPTTTVRSTKYDRTQIEKVPTPGRGIEGIAGNTPGAQNDGVGVAISGSTGLENRFLVDGVDITGLTYGDLGTPVLSEFIEELEVIAGGYNAEWGRAIGGIVNVITKSGGNRFHGSVFGTWSPGLLTRASRSTPVNASSIDVEANRAYSGDFGMELGGPIVKDRLFFYVGLAPQLARTDYTRITKRQTDCRRQLDNGELSGCDPRLTSQGGNADGAADVDPATGFYVTDELDRRTIEGTSRTFSALGKLNLVVTPEHQAQLSVIAVPTESERAGLYGLPSSGGRSTGLTTDAALRWTSKLGGGATDIEALVAWHRSTARSGAIDPALDDQPRQILRDGNLGTWSALGGEDPATAQGCADGGSGDPYIGITNCPMASVPYAIGGPGALTRDREDRKMARLTVTHRAHLLGSHELKAGLDVVRDAKDTARLYSGGAFLENSIGGGQVRVTRWVQLAPPGSDDPRFDQVCRTPDPTPGATAGSIEFACDHLGGTEGAPGTRVEGETLDGAAFLRDSWRIRRNLTFNAGVRYEEQRMRYARAQRNTTDALTGEQLGTDAMSLRGNWAPRLGLIWDPTGIGAAKVFAAWGRFFESIPMDINDRSFGGEVSYVQTFQTGGTAPPCGPSDPRLGGPDGTGCLTPTGSPTDEQLLGSSGVLVAPGLRAQFMDEALAGVEYQLAPDLKVGVTYQHRVLGRVIEDVSTDGAQTYIIANPGEWSRAEEDKLEARIAATEDAADRGRLERQLALYRGIRSFDRPARSYDALEITVARRFARGLFTQASYTYSRTVGNYPGSVSYDNGQIDPNISSQYDLIELLANRHGKLPQDRPHAIKLDAHYTADLGRRSALTLGTRIRMMSGSPTNALGAHYLYGPDESFLLPRGQLGRSAIEHGVDLHVAYARQLGEGVTAEVFADIFNVYDKQGAAELDRTYAPAVRTASAAGGGGSPNNVNPISGGTYEDLVWAKASDANGVETTTPTARNPNFGRPVSRYAPTSARLGFRIRF